MAAETIELVVFELGGVRYGADLTQVIRLDFFDPGSSVGAPLGKPREGTRALMINAGDGRDCVWRSTPSTGYAACR